jgi:hypothetical protein
MVVLSNISVVEISNAEIENNIKKNRKIEDCKIKTVTLGAHQVIHLSVHTKNPKGLD